MKINFNKPLFNLEGRAIDENMGKILAQSLASLSKGESIKLWAWALSLFKGETLELDKVDAGVLKGLIETSESLTILSKAQMLAIMEEAEKADKKK